MLLVNILASLVWYHWLIIGVGIFVFISLVVGAALMIETGRRVYLHTLSKRMDNDWGRVCSAPNNPEQVKMWDDGIAYMKQFQDKKHDISITSKDGLKLAAEFYYFGGKKSVLFLCGRCECLMYGYFYAKPYIDKGYNCLFIDPRAHGYSEGEFATVGIKEGEDALEWMKYVSKEFGQEKFTLHCLCVGGSAGLIATTSQENPGLVEAIVFDGLFINFLDSYRRHYVALGHKVFPVFYIIWWWFKYYTGVSVKQSNPEKLIQQIDCPVLFIHTKTDKYSIPENVEKMFATVKNENKKIVWFDIGSHSHIRNNATEQYDNAVKEFLTSLQ